MLNELYQSLDPVAFSAGPFTVRWYGIAYVLGFLCAGLVMWSTAKRWRVRFDADALLDIMFCVIIGIILGARLGYVVFYGDGYYWEHPLKILAFSEGGMSFHGGLIGALVAGIAAARLTGIPYLTLADLGAIAAPIGLFFGRCANFVNGELWGAVTDLPWGVVFGGSAGELARHPSQLYEAVLEGIVLFVVLFALSRRRPARPRGTFIGVFLTYYGVCRILIEFVREPDAQLGYLWGGWLTMGQVLSAPLVLVGVAVLAYALVAKRPQQGLPEPPAVCEAVPGEAAPDDEAAAGEAVPDESMATAAAAGAAAAGEACGAAAGGDAPDDASGGDGDGNPVWTADGRACGCADDRQAIDETEGTTMDVTFYKCNHCGNIAVKPYDRRVPLVCCGEKMAQLIANDTDAALEKHVPVATVEGSVVHVEVGSTLHPMTDEHLIAFVCLTTEKGYQFVELSADSQPVVDFAVAPGDAPLKVYEYCNLHGLWVTEL